MAIPYLIHSSTFGDSRGLLNAFPDFDMKAIVRMYAISPAHEHVIRAWQGHRHERKWFMPVSGSFEVQIIPIDDAGKPKVDQRLKRELNGSESTILAIPGGYLNGFKALTVNASLLVFSDFGLEASKADDIRFTLEEIPWE